MKKIKLWRDIGLIIGLFYIPFSMFKFYQFWEKRQGWDLFLALEFLALGILLVGTWRSNNRSWRLRPRKTRSLKSPHPSLSPSPSPSVSTPQKLQSVRLSFPLPRKSQSQRKIRKLDSPVIGFRAWIIHPVQDRSGTKFHLELLPLNAGFGEWTPGTNKAVCKRLELPLVGVNPVDLSAIHYPAEPGCGCGFWIKDSIKGATRYRSVGLGVLGVAMGWGRVQAHQDGWRCEYATPLAFSYHLSVTDGLRDRLLSNALKQLSMKFEVPLMEEGELENWYKENTEK